MALIHRHRHKSVRNLPYKNCYRGARLRGTRMGDTDLLEMLQYHQHFYAYIRRELAEIRAEIEKQQQQRFPPSASAGKAKKNTGTNNRKSNEDKDQGAR